MSPLSHILAQPPCRFWSTNRIGEGNSCRTSSLMKSKQGASDHMTNHVPVKHLCQFGLCLREFAAFFSFFFFLSQSAGTLCFVVFALWIYSIIASYMWIPWTELLLLVIKTSFYISNLLSLEQCDLFVSLKRRHESMSIAVTFFF